MNWGPWTVLVEAERRVPSLRYARGAVGIAAAIWLTTHLVGDFPTYIRFFFFMMLP
jgi:hypothetical protein